MKKTKLFFALFILLAAWSLPAQVMVKDINPGGNDALTLNYQQIVKSGSLLYFPADDGVHGRELWKSNGVSAGTNMVIDLNPAAGAGSDPDQLTVHGNRLFFVADDGVHGRELWVKDGNNPPQLLELESGAAGATEIRSIIAVGSEFYFLATTPSLGGQLWHYDGIGAPSAKLFAGGIDPAYLDYGNDHIWGHWDEIAYESVTNSLYWFGWDNPPQYKLWKYALGNASPGIVGTFDAAYVTLQPPVPLNGYVYFPAYVSPGFQNLELFRSDGAAISLFQDFVPGNGSSVPYHLTLYNNNLYFLANSAAFPFFQSIGRIDASHNVYFPVGPPGFQGAYHSDGFPNGNPFRIVNNRLYVQNNTKVYIFNTAGTAILPTPKLENFLTNINTSGLIKSGNKYFYQNWAASHSPQVFYDDDGAGGPLVITAFDGLCDCYMRPFVLRGNMLYFPALTVAGGWELWKLDPALFPFAPGPDPTERETALENHSPAPFTLGPNPADASCTLRFDTPTGEVFDLAVFDNTGKKVAEARLSTGLGEYVIPTANLPKGLYFIQLRGENTRLTYLDRVVVSR